MRSVARLAPLLLAVLLLCPARAAETRTSGRYRYAVENGGAVILEYTGAAADIVVPDTLGGAPVTAIGAFAFWQHKQAESVTLPPTVVSVAPGAFGYCPKLMIIALQNECFRFEDGALYNAAGNILHTVLYTRQTEAFAVPDGVRGIGAYAFAHHDRLKSVTLPDSLETIGEGAFLWCGALDGVTLPDSLTVLGARAFYFCENLSYMRIPDKVTEIPDYAFFSCIRLAEVSLPDTVERIGEGAFGYCAELSAIDLPPDAMLAANAFIGCKSLYAD